VTELSATEHDPTGSGTSAEDEKPRVLRADAARNRALILAAAATVFAERGLEATLDDIAAYAGVGVATVYRRFPNKEVLVEALFEESVQQVVDLAMRAEHADDSWNGLVMFLEEVTRMHTENTGLRDLMLHGTYLQDRVANAKDCILPVVTRLVNRAQHDGHLRDDFVVSDIPLIELMLSSVARYTNDSAPELWRRYLGVILDGICSERSTHRALPEGPSVKVVDAALHANHRRH
jgi:AcrR family transcriptional regulator